MVASPRSRGSLPAPRPPPASSLQESHLPEMGALEGAASSPAAHAKPVLTEKSPQGSSGGLSQREAIAMTRARFQPSQRPHSPRWRITARHGRRVSVPMVQPGHLIHATD